MEKRVLENLVIILNDYEYSYDFETDGIETYDADKTQNVIK